MQAGAAQGDITVVGSGLSAGDRVVVNGQYRLQAGTRVDTGPVKAKAAS